MSENAVVYCTNHKYIDQTATSLCSLIDNYGKNKELSILIMGDDLDNDDIFILRELPNWLNKQKVEVSVWNPPEIIKKVNNYYNADFPVLTIWCLFIPFYFNSFKKILYLDSDTLIYTDVDSVFAQIMSEKAVYAVKDFYISMICGTEVERSYNEISTFENYCNSGVIGYNVKKYNSIVDLDALIDICNKNNYLYPDQTILNNMCQESIGFLGFEYNYQKNDAWLFNWALKQAKNIGIAKEIEKSRNKVQIKHFVPYEANSKPWQHFGMWDRWDVDYYWYYLKLKTLQMQNFKS